ncbi:hypothetical protein LC653_23990 [Nostoc sp. CHAB 5784]|uniref:COG1470 family protein n=1 Tax=Nostoc mirabile TaxID=2907820 RepID=UPI001E4038A5|nr:hypothetical protein [Nostoc mirabile]MCC5666871.1 hypothetical protein [Nostoc mirabile CHAB5784]
MTTAERQSNQQVSDLEMADILALPDSERQIVLWMLQTAEAVSLSEVAAYIGEDQEVTFTMLDYLVQRSFLQLLEGEGEPSYRIRFRHETSSEDVTAQLSPGLPLALIVNPSGAQTVVAGSTFELCVTVINKGNQSALIDLFLDESSHTVRQWCAEPNKRVALYSNSSSELIFEFQVPVQTLLGIYNYTLVVDAPQHYPEDTPILHLQWLQVLPPVETAVRVNDPTFTLQPVTTSQTPTPLRPGESFSVNVSVYNRSDRVDRFRITCPDIPESWFKVVYPQGLEQIGMMIAPDALDLNPGARGDILLLLTPPLDAIAGIYFPTVRLYSTNNPNLVLLDVVYVQVLPVYLITAEFLILRSRVRNQEGIFQLKLTNAGNITREVLIRTQTADEKELCTYTVEPSCVRLLPKSSTNIDLRVKPNKWWRRPVYGAPELIEFRVELEDTEQLPLPNYIPQGTLIWEPRPWWQFLPLFIAGVATLVAIAFLIWWTFFKPPAQPKIVEFASANNLYQEVNNDFIRLNWQIRNPRQIHLLTITGQSADSTASVAPIVYDFSQGVPNELKESCSLRSVLICQNVRTGASLASEYIFDLKVFSKNNKETATDSLKTNPIKIAPLPIPKIIEFSSDKPIYEEAILNPRPIVKAAKSKRNPVININNSILLNWKISNPEQLNQLNIIAKAADGTNITVKLYDFSQGVDRNLKQLCQIGDALICKNVPTGIKQGGSYTFELIVSSQKGQEKPSDLKKIDNIQIKPQPPQIVEFKVNGKDAPAKYLIPIGGVNAAKNMYISWKVEGGKDVKVELLPAPGSVPLSGSASYPLEDKAGSITMTLQVKSSDGEPITRAVTIETFALPVLAPPTIKTFTPPQSLKQPIPPVPTPPSAASAVPPVSPGRETGASGTNSGSQPAPNSGAASPPAVDSPTPSEPDLLSPSELPPKFD